MPDVAVAVVVELHEDEVHALHRVERDGRVGARALRRRGEVVALAGVGVQVGAQGGDEGGVGGGAVVFVVDVEAVDADVAEGAQAGVEAGAGAEEVPEGGGELGGLGVGGEGGSGDGAAEAEEDFLAGGLALADLGGEGGAAHEAGGALGGHG